MKNLYKIFLVTTAMILFNSCNTTNQPMNLNPEGVITPGL
jgi:hypothetical protein